MKVDDSRRAFALLLQTGARKRPSHEIVSVSLSRCLCFVRVSTIAGVEAVVDPAGIDLVLLCDHFVQELLQLLPQTQLLVPLPQRLVLLRVDNVLGSPVLSIQKLWVRIEAEGYFKRRAPEGSLEKGWGHTIDRGVQTQSCNDGGARVHRIECFATQRGCSARCSAPRWLWDFALALNIMNTLSLSRRCFEQSTLKKLHEESISARPEVRHIKPSVASSPQAVKCYSDTSESARCSSKHTRRPD